VLDFSTMQRRPLLVLIGLSCASSGALAARAVPMAPQIRPAPSQEIRDKFHEAIVKGMGGEVEVVLPAEVKVKLYSAPDLLECTGGACIAKVAANLRADRVVVSDIDQIGKNYAIKILIFDAAGAEVGKSTETC
jgi:hypothetical protein